MGKPYLMKEALVLQEVESTIGTAITLAEDDMIIVQDVSLTPSYADTANEGLNAGTFSKEPGVSGVRSATLEFKMAIKGSGTIDAAPLGLGELLKGCGFSETIAGSTSVTYKPANPETSLTMGVQVPGSGGASNDMLYVLRGCMGNVKFTLKAGELMWATFTFTGAWVDPADGTHLVRSTAWDTTAPLAFNAPAMTFHGTTLSFDQIEIDMGQEVGLRPDANTDGGILAAQITSRRVAGTVDIEAEVLTTFDIWTKVSANTTGAIAMTEQSATAGSGVSVSLPVVRFKEPGIADRNGVMTTPVSFEALRSATVGNDEISLIFT